MTEPPVEQTPAVPTYWREKEGMYIHTKRHGRHYNAYKEEGIGLFVWHTIVVKERES